MTLKKYMGTLFVYLLVPFVICWLIFYFFIPQHYFGIYPCFLPFFLLLGASFYKIIDQNAVMEQRVFLMWFTGHTFFKLFVSLIIILLYAFMVKTNLVAFMLSYVVFYLVLSVLEVQLFVKMTKRKANNVE